MFLLRIICLFHDTVSATQYSAAQLVKKVLGVMSHFYLIMCYNAFCFDSFKPCCGRRKELGNFIGASVSKFISLQFSDRNV
jgi:hypothetical protein